MSVDATYTNKSSLTSSIIFKRAKGSWDQKVWELLLVPFWGWGNWSSERLGSLAEVTELENCPTWWTLWGFPQLLEDRPWLKASFGTSWAEKNSTLTWVRWRSPKSQPFLGSTSIQCRTNRVREGRDWLGQLRLLRSLDGGVEGEEAGEGPGPAHRQPWCGQRNLDLI